jgi:hypothetical protein
MAFKAGCIQHMPCSQCIAPEAAGSALQPCSLCSTAHTSSISCNGVLPIEGCRPGCMWCLANCQWCIVVQHHVVTCVVSQWYCAVPAMARDSMAVRLRVPHNNVMCCVCCLSCHFTSHTAAVHAVHAGLTIHWSYGARMYESRQDTFGLKSACRW